MSAGRIFDLFENECFAQVLFVTHASVICGILTEEDVPESSTCKNRLQKREIKNEFNEPKYPIGFGRGD